MVDSLLPVGYFGGTVDLSNQNQPLLIPDMAFKDVAFIDRLILSDNELQSFKIFKSDTRVGHKLG